MMDDISPVIAQLYIELHQSGSIMVSGNIQDKAHALAILEGARDAVIKFHEKNSPILIPNAL